MRSLSAVVKLGNPIPWVVETISIAVLAFTEDTPIPNAPVGSVKLFVIITSP